MSGYSGGCAATVTNRTCECCAIKCGRWQHWYVLAYFMCLQWVENETKFNSWCTGLIALFTAMHAFQFASFASHFVFFNNNFYRPAGTRYAQVAAATSKCRLLNSCIGYMTWFYCWDAKSFTNFPFTFYE